MSRSKNHHYLFDEEFYDGAGPDIGCDPRIPKNTGPYSLYLDGCLVDTVKFVPATNEEQSLDVQACWASPDLELSNT